MIGDITLTATDASTFEVWKHRALDFYAGSGDVGLRPRPVGDILRACRDGDLVIVQEKHAAPGDEILAIAALFDRNPEDDEDDTPTDGGAEAPDRELLPLECGGMFVDPRLGGMEMQCLLTAALIAPKVLANQPSPASETVPDRFGTPTKAAYFAVTKSGEDGAKSAHNLMKCGFAEFRPADAFLEKAYGDAAQNAATKRFFEFDDADDAKLIGLCKRLLDVHDSRVVHRKKDGLNVGITTNLAILARPGLREHLLRPFVEGTSDRDGNPSGNRGD